MATATPASRLGQLIADYTRTHSASLTGLADRIGITRETLAQRRNGELRSLPAQANLLALATEIGQPYRQVFDAALYDAGYLTKTNARTPRPYNEVLRDAIAALTEAARLTNQPVRHTSSGNWGPTPIPAPPCPSTGPSPSPAP